MQIGPPIAYNVCAAAAPICILWVNLRQACILKLGPDDDLDEVETCHPCKLNN